MVTNENLKEIFPGLTVPLLTPTWYMTWIQRPLMSTRVEQRAGLYEEDFPQNIPRGDVFIKDYFQSYKNFWPYRAELKKELTFSASMRAAADRTLRSAHFTVFGDSRVHSTRFVAVHVRRGDLLSRSNYDRGYRPAEPSYFYKAMAMFKKNPLERALFIVTSNDEQWVRTHLRLEDTYVSAGRSAVEDMALLSACNDTIASMGTYSWWAAFLTPGRKIYFRDALVNGSLMDWEYPVNDTFPSSWIALEN